jgi:tRNA pseudouridine55 synthase
LKIKVVCGPGTYIRSLARDIGQALGCGGYLADLERTRVGEYGLEQAVRVEDLSK